jgi:hypothetical protein
MIAVQPLLCRPGKRQSFGTEGNSHAGFGQGWSAAESRYVWNDGTEAELVLSLLGQVRPMRLTLAGMGYVSPQVPVQVMEVYANGYRADYRRLSEPGGIELRFDIEPEWWLMRGGSPVLRLLFHLPNSVSPAELGLGEDRRALGFCFQSFQLETSVDA